MEHNLLLLLDLKLRLLFWVILGSTVGLLVELNTASPKNRIILFHDSLVKGSWVIRILVAIVNILVGASCAYVVTPLSLNYMSIPETGEVGAGFLVGVASLSMVRTYTIAWRNKKLLSGFVGALIEFFYNRYKDGGSKK